MLSIIQSAQEVKRGSVFKSFEVRLMEGGHVQPKQLLPNKDCIS